MTPVLIRSIFLMVGASLFGSFGAVFLKMGAAGTSRNIVSFLNPKLAVGVALYLGSSVLYVLGIRGGPLSILYPIVSLSYIWTMIWARILFKEAFTARKVAALALILAGVIMVGIAAQ